MEQILLTVFQGSVDFPDTSTQKICFQILRKFVEFFGCSTELTNGIKPMDQTYNVYVRPGFVQFIYKSIVPACFIAPLRQNEDSQLLNDCMLCLKSVFHSRGHDEFSAYLQTQLFPQHFPNYSNSIELIQALTSSDNKITKNALKQFFQQHKTKEIT